MREGRGGFETAMQWEAETGEMRPQAQNSAPPPQMGEAGGNLPEPSEGAWPCDLDHRLLASRPGRGQSLLS